jgi:ankyrin repeat protein
MLRPPLLARRARRLPATLLAGLLAAHAIAAPASAPLADAMERRQLDTVRALLSDTTVNAPQPDGMTALHWAARHDEANSARALLQAGANANAVNRYGLTPLSLACTNGSTELVNLLLTAGADPNLAIRGGETPLMTAARTGRIGPVQALLARGARIDDRLPTGGQTALMWAAHEGHAEVSGRIACRRCGLAARSRHWLHPTTVRRAHRPPRSCPPAPAGRR